MFTSSFRCMVTNPTFGCLLLFGAALAALIMANTGTSALYESIINFPIHTGSLQSSHMTVQSIVNDGLMALFFLSVGLEVKYELLKGALNSRSRASFPTIAALGGMVAPAIIYSLITGSTPLLRAGWAIPTATDIAFAGGVLKLLGKRVSTSLKAFLLALAIIDDLIATLIIALCYNSTLNLRVLAAAGVIIGMMTLMNRANVRSIALYLLLGTALWGCILLSGIHATLSGVIVGGLIPLTLPVTDVSPARTLNRRLQSWVAYLILPLFAFTNAGISLQSVGQEHWFSLLPWGIITSLVIGKPMGIILFTAVAIKLKLAKLPDDTAFRHIAAVAMLCGIGFTMSIFIANLTFGKSETIACVLAKAGILLGSVTAALLGYITLRLTLPPLRVSNATGNTRT
ncbi:Na+/H+ antiporter NhaA [Sodalis endosymbiont of Henestaris halophilus]|uniref:Na+/H+ antiporter NhaA n=1 Tax=Sodalis endosymbiont of Henestaris halophilus TaxID=1929246 RepID=UPI000BBFE6CB|nr:Na+/H+ antiporter NhaA [Sodalis endosymbiont of Henestaris halophilus]SNC58571.1 Na(+)/H(+) antiporter NhaA [Sodalis endosymbiont of Henestaris halophilus]